MKLNLRKLTSPVLIGAAGLLTGCSEKEPPLTPKQMLRRVELDRRGFNESADGFIKRLHSKVREQGVSQDPAKYLSNLESAMTGNDNASSSSSYETTAFNVVLQQSILNSALEKGEISKNLYDYLYESKLGFEISINTWHFKNAGELKNKILQPAFAEGLLPQDLEAYFDSQEWYAREVRSEPSEIKDFQSQISLKDFLDQLREMKEANFEFTPEITRAIIKCPSWTSISEALKVMKMGAITINDLKKILAEKFSADKGDYKNDALAKRVKFYEEKLIPLAIAQAQTLKHNTDKIEEKFFIKMQAVRFGDPKLRLNNYMTVFEETLAELTSLTNN